MNILGRLTGYRHGPDLGRVMKLTMAATSARDYPPIVLQGFQEFPDLPILRPLLDLG
jgi:hypothetical protein